MTGAQRKLLAEHGPYRASKHGEIIGRYGYWYVSSFATGPTSGRLPVSKRWDKALVAMLNEIVREEKAASSRSKRKAGA